VIVTPRKCGFLNRYDNVRYDLLSQLDLFWYWHVRLRSNMNDEMKKKKLGDMDDACIETKQKD